MGGGLDRRRYLDERQPSELEPRSDEDLSVPEKETTARLGDRAGATAADAEASSDRIVGGSDVQANDSPATVERASDDSDSSDEDDTSTNYTLREGVARQMDPEERLSVRRELADEGSDASVRADAQASFQTDQEHHARPPELQEMVDVSATAPDGTTVGTSGFTSPTGESITGNSLSGDIQSRAGDLGGDALAGSRLDPLGLMDAADEGATGSALSSDRQVEQALFEASGGQVGWGVSFDVGGQKITFDTEKGPSGDFGRPSASAGVTVTTDAGTSIRVGVGETPEGAPGTGGGTDDEKPAPDDDTAPPTTLSDEQVERAIAAHGTGIYEAGGRAEEESGSNATTIAWAGSDVDPRLAQYGPEGPQTVDAGAGWQPPVDTLFDPPQEGGAEGPPTAGSGVPGAPPAAGSVSLGSGDGGDEDGGVQAATLRAGNDPLGMGSMDVRDAGLAGEAPPDEEDLGMKMDANGATIDLVTGQVVGGGEAPVPITAEPPPAHGELAGADVTAIAAGTAATDLSRVELPTEDLGMLESPDGGEFAGAELSGADLSATAWGSIGDFHTDEALAGANEGELGGPPGEEGGGFPQQPGGEG